MMSNPKIIVWVPSSEDPVPEQSWVVCNEQRTHYIYGGSADEDGALYIFTTEEKVERFIAQGDLPSGATTELYTWKELVKRFSDQHREVLVDPTGQPAFVMKLPLEENPNLVPPFLEES